MPLRRRVTLAFTLLGLALSLLFAATAIWVAEDYEHVLANEILRGQAEDYGLRMANHLPATLPRTQRLSGYRADAPDLPPAYATLPAGIHEDDASDGIHVGVFDTAIGRLVFVIDLSDIEALERHLDLLLAGIVVFGTLLAGTLGWLLSSVALHPVRTLAEGVEGLPVQPRETHLARGASRDELGRLAAAIDDYQRRLLEADRREQAFFADASHELRTPLAVVQGVTEVLLDDADASPAHAARLQRLERGVRDMRHLVEAMLSAARRTPLQAEALVAEDLLRAAAEIALAGKPGITTVVAAQGALQAPRREALLLVAGFARKRVQATPTGPLPRARDRERLLLQFQPAEAHAPDPSRTDTATADTGSGSALLDRLATRLGWRVAMDGAGGVTIRMDAADAGPSP
jgi:signal transduction histidine kinase